MKDLQDIESQLGINNSAAVVEEINHPLLEKQNIHLCIKREDLLHPIISGNKWRKLKYTLADALKRNSEHLISMGGAYSNHLHALAYIGKELNLKTTGLIRGEPQDNPTLNDLKEWGMQLEFISRTDYRNLRKHKSFNSAPAQQYHGYWILEGGYGHHALTGVKEIMADVDSDYDTLAIACGTGTTLAGLTQAISKKKKLIGFSSLKGGGFLEKEVKKLIGNNSKTNWSINFDYHFGGFAKSDESLLAFIDDFETITKIPLEPIYNGKMLFGLFNLIKKERLKKDSRILAIHTGGLQGVRSTQNVSNMSNNDKKD